MGKIDELIKELCPDGVEYVKLGEIATLSRGKVYSKEYVTENAGVYPLYSSQTRNDGIFGLISSFDYEGEYLTWTTDGAYAGSIFHRKGKFSITNVCGLITIKNKCISYRFLYYWLSIHAKEYVYEGMGNPKLMTNQMIGIQIPLPPLSIQQQIVEILDTFTDSISNLQEELELREKQMEYYREDLFVNAEDAEWKTLGEIGTLIRGKRFCHRDSVESGIPCIHYGELYTYYGVSADTTKSFVREDLAPKLRFAKKGDVVIVGAGENDIDIGVGVAYFGERDVAVHDACYTFSNHNMNPKFVSYWLRTNTYHQQIRQYVSSGKICSISTDGLAKAKIPVPSLSRQQEIVDILDTFESMITNIKEEIELRQKQYEYYREKLLTFD